MAPSWSQRTLDIIHYTDYLDQLQEIYRHRDPMVETSIEETHALLERYRKRDKEGLISSLLDLKWFPYKESYLDLFRMDPEAMTKNPRTVNRIFDTLEKMGEEKLLKGVQESVKVERTKSRERDLIDWTRSTFQQVGLDDLRRSSEGIVILKADESSCREFLKNDLDLGFESIPEFIGKAGKEYVIGKAKFMGGMNEGRSSDLEERMEHLDQNRRANMILLLDGVFWLQYGQPQYRRIERHQNKVFSALLLESYMNDILRSQ